MKTKMSININTKNIMPYKNNSNQAGGGIWDFLGGKKEEKRTNHFQNAIISEDQLINSFEGLSDSAKRYYNAYNQHIQNLITLDDIYAMKGLLTTFRKNVLNDFKNVDKIDRSNPLFLRNYLASDDTTPRNFRKEHLLSQVRYCIRRFNPKDEILIQDIDIKLEDNKALVTIRTINGDLHERKVMVDDNFNLDMDKMKSDLREIIKSIKQKMDFEIEVISDFELPEDGGLELPGAMFVTPGGLEQKLAGFGGQSVVRVGPDDPIPLSQGAKSGKAPTPAPAKDFILGYSTTKPKSLSKRGKPEDQGQPPAPDVGLEQGFAGRQLDQASVKDELLKLLDGPSGMMSPDEIKQAIGGQQAPPLPAIVATQVQPTKGSSRTKKANLPLGTGDVLEQKCKAITDPDACKKVLGCWYNYTKKVCHRDVKI